MLAADAAVVFVARNAVLCLVLHLALAPVLHPASPAQHLASPTQHLASPTPAQYLASPAQYLVDLPARQVAQLVFPIMLILVPKWKKHQHRLKKERQHLKMMLRNFC